MSRFVVKSFRRNEIQEVILGCGSLGEGGLFWPSGAGNSPLFSFRISMMWSARFRIWTKFRMFRMAMISTTMINRESIAVSTNLFRRRFSMVGGVRYRHRCCLFFPCSVVFCPAISDLLDVVAKSPYGADLDVCAKTAELLSKVREVDADRVHVRLSVRPDAV